MKFTSTILLILFFLRTVLLAFYCKKEESNAIITANSSEKIEIFLNNRIYSFIEQLFPKNHIQN